MKLTLRDLALGAILPLAAPVLTQAQAPSAPETNSHIQVIKSINSNTSTPGLAFLEAILSVSAVAGIIVTASKIPKYLETRKAEQYVKKYDISLPELKSLYDEFTGYGYTTKLWRYIDLGWVTHPDGSEIETRVAAQTRLGGQAYSRFDGPRVVSSNLQQDGPK